MGRIVVNEFMSLDGVVQAPGGAEEDTEAGFRHGGWHIPYMDEAAGARIQAGLDEAGGFLLGRRTYQIFAGYWPHAPEEELAPAGPLNSKPKYVVSTTLAEPLAWQNSRLVDLGPGLATALETLREEQERDLHVIGSSRLVQALLERGLVDELRLMIDPIVLGGGKRIFPADSARHPLSLVSSEIVSTGAVLAIYRFGGSGE